MQFQTRLQFRVKESFTETFDKSDLTRKSGDYASQTLISGGCLVVKTDEPLKTIDPKVKITLNFRVCSIKKFLLIVKLVFSFLKFSYDYFS